MQDDLINILFAGDFIPPDNSNLVITRELDDLLREKDFSLVNLESPLTINNKKIFKGGVNIKRKPEAIQNLIGCHFDAACLSNNHIRDFGNDGVLSTLKTCHKSNIKTLGAGKNADDSKTPLEIELKGKKICFLNYSETEYNAATKTSGGANTFDLIGASREIKYYKQKNDFVFVIYHGGLEFHNLPLPSLKMRLEFLIENGADSVICHHTHYISGYSYFMNKPIFYGLGNFYFRYKSKKLINNQELHSGILLKLKIKNDDMGFELIPIRKDLSQNRLELADGKIEEVAFSEKISDINCILNSEEKLFKYWEREADTYYRKYFFLISYNNRFIIRLLKRINLIVPLPIKRKNLLRKLNIFRCDSHREMLIFSFNLIADKK